MRYYVIFISLDGMLTSFKQQILTICRTHNQLEFLINIKKNSRFNPLMLTDIHVGLMGYKVSLPLENHSKHHTHACNASVLYKWVLHKV